MCVYVSQNKNGLCMSSLRLNFAHMRICLIRTLVPRLGLNIHFLALRQHFCMCFVWQIPPLPIPFTFPYKKKTPGARSTDTPFPARKPPFSRTNLCTPPGRVPKRKHTSKGRCPTQSPVLQIPTSMAGDWWLTRLAHYTCVCTHHAYTHQSLFFQINN